jgi:hypothetical protein
MRMDYAINFRARLEGAFDFILISVYIIYTRKSGYLM